jgi:hypothetical protein
MPAEPSALPARQEWRVPLGAHMSLQMSLEGGKDVRRYGDIRMPAAVFGGSQIQPAVDVVGRALDSDRTVKHVDVAALEAEDLSDPQMTPRCELHGNAPLRRHCSDEALDLGD